MSTGKRRTVNLNPTEKDHRLAAAVAAGVAMVADDFDMFNLLVPIMAAVLWANSNEPYSHQEAVVDSIELIRSYREFKK